MLNKFQVKRNILVFNYKDWYNTFRETLAILQELLNLTQKEKKAL